MYKDLISYFIRNYSRSYRYIPPTLAFIMFVIFLYSYKPNYVMSSFAVTASVLFVVSSWICYTFMLTEHRVQEQLSVMHLRSVSRYYMGLLSAVLAVAFVFAVFALGYPFVFDKLVRQPTLAELVVGLLAHLGMACLGTATACYFNQRFVPRPLFAIGGLLGIAILSFCQGPLEEQLGSGLQWITWPLPPVFQLIDLLMNYDSYSFGGTIRSLVLPFLYGGLLAAVFIRLMKRRYAG